MYNQLMNVEEILGYLQEAAGFYYTQNPVQWQEAFQTLANNSKLVNVIGGEASAQITNIASAYTTVGKDIYATAESGLKNAPVIEGVFTRADEEVAVVGESALGTYIAGIAAGLPLTAAIAGIASGLGIGILGYETAPDGWIDISNAIFDTNLSYGDASPLIRSYVNGMFALDTNGHVQTYLEKSVLDKAYAYFKEHLIGGIDYSFLDDAIWVPESGSTVPTVCSNPQTLSNKSVAIGADLTDELLDYVYDLVQVTAQALDIEVDEFSMQGVVNQLRDLYPNYNNADFFNIMLYYWYYRGETRVFELCIDGFRFNDDHIIVNVGDHRYPIVGDPGEPYEDRDFSYELTNEDFHGAYNPGSTSASMVFSFLKNLTTGTATVTDNGHTQNTHMGKVYLNSYTYGYKTGESSDIHVAISTAGALEDVLPDLDDDLKSKGIRIGNGTALPRKTNFQDQYANWYGNKKEVGQPDVNGEPEIHTYIPTPVPMTYPNPDQLGENGIGIVENPLSAPAVCPEYLPGALPAALPEAAPATDIAGSQENAIDAFNDSRRTPDSAPDPLPEYEPNPQYPTNPPSEPGGDSGATPLPADIPGVESSGLVSVYNPTKAQLVSFSQWLWSPNFLDNFLKIFQNPMDAIIGLHVIYATPTTGSSGNIIAGFLDSGVSSKIVTKQYSEIDCGTVKVPEYFGNALDYEPYVQIHAYLPFVGIVALKPNDILGKSLNIKYGVDVLTGACLAMLTTYKGSGADQSKILTYTYSGNCATQVPISGGSYAQMITGLASMALGVGTGIVSGNPLAVAGGVMAGVMSSHFDVSHSGSLSSNPGAMGPRKPFLIITRKSAYEAQGYNQFYGFPANLTVTLGSCKGYTRVKSVHIDSISKATDTEKTEIETLLRQGVIIK